MSDTEKITELPKSTRPHLTQPHLTQPHLTQPHITQPVSYTHLDVYKRQEVIPAKEAEAA